MINFKKDYNFKGIEIKDAYYSFKKIIITEENIIAVFNIYQDEDPETIDIFAEERFVFPAGEPNFNKLVKSMDTKTKLFGTIKSIIGVEE